MSSEILNTSMPASREICILRWPVSHILAKAGQGANVTIESWLNSPSTGITLYVTCVKCSAMVRIILVPPLRCQNIPKYPGHHQGFSRTLLRSVPSDPKTPRMDSPTTLENRQPCDPLRPLAFVL